MPLRPRLLADLRAALGAAVTPAITAADPAHDIYEVYILGLILQAAAAEGASVTYEDVTGANGGIATFRDSPGHIWWSSRPFTHAIIAFAGKPHLEAHVGIYVSGNSGVLHEADVAVIRRDEGVTCRNNQVPPRSKSLVLGAECKFYSTRLGLHLGRGFMGLCGDLKGRGLFFVSNSASPSIERLLAHHAKWKGYSVIPPNQDSVAHLTHLFRETFQNFKARN